MSYSCELHETWNDHDTTTTVLTAGLRSKDCFGGAEVPDGKVERGAVVGPEAYALEVEGAGAGVWVAVGFLKRRRTA